MNYRDQELNTALISNDSQKAKSLANTLSACGLGKVTVLNRESLTPNSLKNFELILAFTAKSDENFDWILDLRQSDFEANLVVVTEHISAETTHMFFEAGITDVIPLEHIDLLKFRIGQYHTHYAKSKSDDSVVEMIALDRITNALIEGKSTASISNLVLDGVYETVGIERSRIYLYDEQANQLSLYAEKINRGIVQKLEERTGISMHATVPILEEDSVFMHVIRNQKIFVADDPQIIRKIVREHTSNPILKQLADWAIGLVGIKNFAIFPLLSGSKLLGLLTFSAPKKLSDLQLSTAARFAQHASIVLSKHLDQLTLAKNEERFRAISIYTANWEIWIDTTGKPVWINPGVDAIIGYTADELLAMPDYFERLIHKDDYPEVMRILNEALKNKTGGEGLEFRIRHKNGTTLWFSISWKTVYDSQGNWIGIRSSAVDISLRKQHELSLIDHQAELSEAQSIARLGSWDWNVKKETMFLTKPLCEVIGIPFKNEWISRQDFVEKIVHPDSRTNVENAIEKLRTKFEVRDLEVSVVNSRKKKVTLLIRASHQKSRRQGEQIIRGTALDITLLKKSHEESQASQTRFQKIFESIHDVYYQADSQGILTRVSPSVFNLLGFKPNELIGQPLSKFYTRQNLRDVKTTTHPSNQLDQFEVTLFHKNHNPVVVSINQSRFEDTEGDGFMIHGLMRDITEKKRYEKSLENQRKRLLEIVKLNTQIIETSDQFFYVIQTDTSKSTENQLRYISPQVNKMLGIGELELLNLKGNLRELIHPDDLAGYDDSRMEMALAKKPVRVSYRIQRQNPDEYIWADEYSCPLLNEENKIVEIYGSVKDVTERVQAIINIEYEKRHSMEYQYQLLSSQLNPHFIYNTLNSFQYYILQGNIEESLNHISDFSQLMRRVLENSMSQFISLDEEVMFLEQYIRISQKRMKDKLSFKIETDPEIDTGEVMIPPMLLQPYVENAIIHAFINSPRTPELYVAIYQDENLIRCLIEDNGIGRENSMLNRNSDAPDKKRSIAMNINQTRLNLLNQITDRNFKLNVEDRYDTHGTPCGTRVVITYESSPSKVKVPINLKHYRGNSNPAD